jgi:hypothetical protein
MQENFKIEKLEDNKLLILLYGLINSDNAIKFISEAGRDIQHMKDVRIIYDLREFSGLTEGAKGIIAVFFIQNKKYVYREAVFGLNEITDLLFNELIKLSQRENIKIFNDRLECEDWIYE